MRFCLTQIKELEPDNDHNSLIGLMVLPPGLMRRRISAAPDARFVSLLGLGVRFVRTLFFPKKSVRSNIWMKFLYEGRRAAAVIPQCNAEFLIWVKV